MALTCLRQTLRASRIHMRTFSSMLGKKQIQSIRGETISWTAPPLTRTLIGQWSRTTAGMQAEAREVFRFAIQVILTNHMIRKFVRIQDHSWLMVDKSRYPINKNVYIVGFGKAVLGMSSVVEDIVGDHLVEGMISVPVGIQETLKNNGKMDMLLAPGSKIRVFEGAKNNLPDEDAYQNSLKIIELIKKVRDGDILLVLVSGGGSALLTAPIPPIRLDEIAYVTQLLTGLGCDIKELNIVRKQLSLVKGGGLARLAYPAQVVSLILSSIVGDPLDQIGSGPTVPDKHTAKEAWDILVKFDLLDKLPASVREILRTKVDKEHLETLQMFRTDFSHVQNIIIGSNGVAVEQAAKCSSSLGYVSIVLSTCMVGIARDVGQTMARLGFLICKVYNEVDKSKDKVANVELYMKQFSEVLRGCPVSEKVVTDLVATIETAVKEAKGICLTSGGETVVKVQGTGWGGRNQEMVLSCGIELDKAFSTDTTNLDAKFEVLFLSAGTDGIDASTPAAGAVTYIEQIREAKEQGMDALEYLDNNDSHNFYRTTKAGSDMLVLGHTGTNVMDVQILMVKPKVNSA